jgi:hypothetical protein
MNMYCKFEEFERLNVFWESEWSEYNISKYSTFWGYKKSEEFERVMWPPP